MSETMELAVVSTQNAVQIFTGGGLGALLDGVEAKVRAMQFDASTVAGRDEIRSVAYKVVRTKTALASEATKLTEGWRTATAKVNAERKVAQDRLDALAEEVRAPLTAFENKEKNRVASHEAALADLAMFGRAEGLAVRQLQQALDGLPNLHANRDWEEFRHRADKERAVRLESLTARLAERRKFEADQAELARLRAAEIERQTREREERLKTEAAEKARIEAERRAKEAADAEARRVIEAARKEEERVKVEAERIRIQNERVQAEIEAKRKKEEDARKLAERRATEAENARLEAIRKAEADKTAAKEKADADLKAAIAKERERVEVARKKEEAERLKREADAKHKAAIRAEIAEDISHSNDIVQALIDGRIRHVKVVF